MAVRRIDAVAGSRGGGQFIVDDIVEILRALAHSPPSIMDPDGLTVKSSLAACPLVACPFTPLITAMAKGVSSKTGNRNNNRLYTVNRTQACFAP